MEKLAMCRICLAQDIRLNLIFRTHLQEMYESLVLMPLKTKDKRPLRACYICCARLQNCYELRRNCIQSEELFMQMLSSDEVQSKPVALQAFGNKKRLTAVHNVVHLSMGLTLPLYSDNVEMEALKFYDVKDEQNDPEDIDKDALEENGVHDNTESTDSDDPQLIVKEEQSEDPIDDPTPKESKETNPEDQTSSNLKEHELAQDAFKEVKEESDADKTVAENTNEAIFTLNDNDQELSKSVPQSECVQYTCGTCQQCYSSKCELERHIQSCSDVWKKDLSLDHKTSSHTHSAGKLYQCNMCKKRFRLLRLLIRHMRIHTGEKPYQCSLCKKSFSQEGNLTRHMSTHTDKKPHHCDICDKFYARKGDLAVHIRTHSGEKPFRCKDCDKYFSHKNDLKDHYCTRSRKKPYSCDVCRKKFYQSHNLMKHVRTHTDDKSHHCDICNKFYARKGDLTIHTHTHTAEKPIHCKRCEKYFPHKSDLKDHYCTRSRKKPYSCDICRKRFYLSRNLNKHIRTHIDGKSYHCDICEKFYARKGDMTIHTKP